MSFRSPELIQQFHELDEFDCGRESLNVFLKRFALVNTTLGSARTFVVTAEGSKAVIGYYSLAAAAVEKSTAPERVGKGMPRHPIPVVLLARLAVDRRYQGRGMGGSMLRDALSRCLSAADIVGVRAVLVHAKDEQAAAFYRRYGFSPSPYDKLHLLLLLKDLRETLDSARHLRSQQGLL